MSIDARPARAPRRDGSLLFVVLGLVGLATCASPRTEAPKLASATPRALTATYRATSAGFRHSCAVRGSGALSCWGANVNGESVAPAGAFVSVAAADGYSCAVSAAGALSCWGALPTGATVPTGAFSAVYTSSFAPSRTCALRRDGAILCFAAATGAAALAATPSGPFTQLALGQDYACAIRADGSLACWGSAATPPSTPPSGAFISVAVRAGAGCGVRADGTLACWGGLDPSPTLPAAGPWSAVAYGGAQLCALRTDGAAICWPPDGQGLSDPPGVPFASLSVGPEHACGVRQDGAVSCWGDGFYGQTLAPEDVFTSVSVNAHQACAARADGALVCFAPGRIAKTAEGQPSLPAGSAAKVGECGGDPSFLCALGVRPDGSMFHARYGDSSLPLGPFQSVAAVGAGFCAMREDGTLSCVATGLPDAPSGRYRTVAGMGDYACAIRDDGQLVAWKAASAFLGAPPTGTFTALTVSSNYGCGVRQDGTLACWGSPTCGVASPPSGTFASATVTDGLGCGRRTTGELTCWGCSPHKGTPPASLPSASTSLGLSYAFGCAIDPQGKLVCWGESARNAEPRIATTPASLGPAAAGRSYRAQLTASGGRGPYVFALGAGTAPPGLTLSAAGLFSGTPSVVGTHVFSVRATDQDGYFGDTEYRFSIVDRMPPASIAARSGSGQSARASTVFAAPLVVVVRDADGNPVPSTIVRFAAPSSGPTAIASSWSRATNQNGEASLTPTAGTIAGRYAITAQASGVASAASFDLTNLAGDPASVAVVSGDGQSAALRQAFAAPLVAVVRDAGGNPVAGVGVTFAGPTSGASATLPTSAVVTDADGHASATATANSTAGTYQVIASASGATRGATFRLTNTPGIATRIEVASGDGQQAPTGHAFPAPLVFAVRDTDGNGVPGVTVRFASPATGAGATLATLAATTDDRGQCGVAATANRVAGTYAVTASVEGVDASARATLTNAPSPAVRVQAISGGGQRANVHGAFTAPLVVEADDDAGNPVPGALLTITPPAHGASAVVPASAITDSSGRAALSAAANAVTGIYVLEVSVSGGTQAAQFVLINAPGAPTAVQAFAGKGQTTLVSTPFPQPLGAVVRDADGNPIPGVIVTFTTPSIGPAATIETGQATTDAEGMAWTNAQANTLPGSYAVLATVTGVSEPARFPLNNMGGTSGCDAAGGETGAATLALCALALALATRRRARGSSKKK